MRRYLQRGAVLLILSLFFLLTILPMRTWGETGRVEVRVTDHRAAIGDFRALQVELASLSLHPRGMPRRQGWISLLQHTSPVDLVPLKDGRWKTLGESSVEARRYDAVRVQFGSIEGILRSATRVEVVPVASTVVVDLVVESDRPRVILLDLYVEDQSDHKPGLYAVKIRNIQVQNR